MAKSLLSKAIFSGVALSFSAISYVGYKGYKQSIAPSKFELATSTLGFNGHQNNNGVNVSAAEQQEALLKQLQLAGYLKPAKIWRALNGIGGVNDVEAAYQQIYQAINKSKADSNSPSDFNAKSLRKNFGKVGGELDEQDIQDLLLYLTQDAFGRNQGQERNELTAQNWMTKYHQEYINNARKLGLIDRIEPKDKEYDAAIIAGASRIGEIARLIDFNNMMQKHGIKISNGGTSVLAGAREIWANIDGIEPATLDRLNECYYKNIDIDKANVFLSVGEDSKRTEEGKKYIKYLAAVNGIKLEEFSPFYGCHKKESCLPGRFPGRVYPIYAAGEERKLTETLMTQDVINSYPLAANNSINVVDTKSEGGLRPTTASTARDAAEDFVASIIANNRAGTAQKKYKVLFQTNQPYIERQTIATQREYDKKLKEHGLDAKGYAIAVEGIGFGCKQDPSTVHSEFAALMSEKWQQVNMAAAIGQGIEPKRDIKNLLYQTRNNNSSDNISSCPEDQKPSSTIIGAVQDFFDEFLD